MPSTERQPRRHATYTTRQAAEAIGLAPQRIRRLVQRRLLAPRRGVGGEYRFSFQDLVLLRTAKGLLDAEVSPRRACAALAKLSGDGDKPLSALRLSADGNAVVVREDAALWNAETGQGHLSFRAERFGEVRALGASRVPLAGPPRDEALEDREATGAAASDHWYNLGLDYEDATPERAPEAYRRAIALNPANADAHVNLGRLHQMQGDLKRAMRHYQLALDATRDHQLANYNLGTVFDELGEIEAALGCYRKAPKVADAHYNLARIFELRGDEVATFRHMRNYRNMMKG